MKRKTRQTLLAVGLIIGGIALFILSAAQYQKMNEAPAETAPPRKVSAAPAATPEPLPTPSP